MTQENENVMPAGAMPPEEDVEETTDQDQGEQEELILGKFKSPDEVVPAYQELEKKIGEQGSELSSMKQMNQMLMEQMEKREAQQETPATEEEKDTFNFQESMSQIKEQVENGDISIEDALLQVGNLSSEAATRNAVSKYEEMTAEQQRQAAKEKFFEEHKDFPELQKSGQLEAVKKTLPGMHDDFSAYFALKAQQAQEKAEAQAEVTRIAQGDERTSKVLQKPGNPSKKPGKPIGKMTKAELKQKTLADLEALG